MTVDEPAPNSRRLRRLLVAGSAATVLVAVGIVVALNLASDNSPTAGPGQTPGRTPTGGPTTSETTATPVTSTNSTTSGGGSGSSGGGAGSGSSSSGGGAGSCCGSPPPHPAEPTGITATAVDRYSIRLAWTDNANNEKEYWVLGPGNRVVLAANATSYVWSGLQPGEEYCFQVAAANDGGVSANYAKAEAWVCGPTVPNPPAAPSGVVVSGSGKTSMAVTWADNSSNESGFRVMFADANHQQIALGIVSYGSLTRVFDIPATVETGVEYCAQVQAYNSGGYSDWTSWACATSLPVPAMPSGATATALDATTIRLQWTDNSSIETRYRVSREASVSHRDAPANATSLDWTGLTPGTQYCFYVTAENAQGYFARGAKLCATTPAA